MHASHRPFVFGLAVLLAATTAAADTVITAEEVISCSVQSADIMYVRLKLPGGGIRMLATRDVYELRLSDSSRVAELAAQLPGLKVTRDRIEVRGAQSLFGRVQAAPAPNSSSWSSSPGATVAQTASGCGCGLVTGLAGLAAGLTVAVGVVLFGDPSTSDVPGATMAAIAITIPAATATGVALAGLGRGSSGQAYLGSYVGAAALGAVGFLIDDHYRVFGLAVGLTLGSVPGAVVGYNLR